MMWEKSVMGCIVCNDAGRNMVLEEYKRWKDGGKSCFHL